MASRLGAESVTKTLISASKERILGGEPRALLQQAPGQAGHGSVPNGQLLGERLELLGADETTGWRVQTGVDLAQVPAQSLDDPGSLGNQVIAMVDEQADLPGGTVQAGNGQVRPPLGVTTVEIFKPVPPHTWGVRRTRGRPSSDPAL
ncbi:hypothetical protein [Streptomyces sp. NPDC088794]|uniref:hypothetical protein n=1 Tax=Streptomyces sp. NPDC088794 TaxID=3365902 RepID=UPI003817C484